MNNRKKIIIILFSVLLLFILIYNNVNNSIVEYGEFKGYLWEIKNEDATVYLFGSIHLSDDRIYPFSKEVMDAYESSDYLVVEVNLNDVSSISKSVPLMYYNDDDKIYNHLSTDGVLKLNELCKELNINVDSFENKKIWAVGSSLFQSQLMESKLQLTTGIDKYFLDKTNNNKILELESFQYQFEMFNNFSDEIQENIFLLNLGTIDETYNEFSELLDVFVTEDEVMITKYLLENDDEFTYNEEIEKIIISDRNIEMSNKINDFLKTDKTYFVVVGLSHLIGEKSIIKILQENGYVVNRK